MGCVITSVGFSFGREKLHRFLFPFVGTQRGKEKVLNRRRFSKLKLTFGLVFLAASTGAAGGCYAGYNVEWDPRNYWDSANRLTGDT